MIKVGAALLEHQDFIVSSQMAMAFETEKLKLDFETVKKGVGAVFQDSSKGKYYVALDSGKNEPIACLLLIPEWSDWRNGTVLWIHSVYVVPEYRGKGVYRAMYLELKSKVEKDPALRGLRLYVDKTNTQATQVYEKLGMSKEHYDLFEWMKS